MSRFGHTFVQEHSGRSGVPWWAEVSIPPYQDNRSPVVGWDESAEEGGDEGPPYARGAYSYPRDPFDPRTGPYPGWPPTRAEPDPRDLIPDPTWTTIRRGREANPNPLSGLRQANGGYSGAFVLGITVIGIALGVIAGGVLTGYTHHCVPRRDR